MLGFGCAVRCLPPYSVFSMRSVRLRQRIFSCEALGLLIRLSGGRRIRFYMSKMCLYNFIFLKWFFDIWNYIRKLTQGHSYYQIISFRRYFPFPLCVILTNNFIQNIVQKQNKKSFIEFFLQQMNMYII